MVLLLCRSGKRSALAAEAATKAGFTHAFNILAGFEGEIDGEQQQGWSQERLAEPANFEPLVRGRDRARLRTPCGAIFRFCRSASTAASWSGSTTRPPRTSRRAVTQVANALGTVTPIREIVELAHRAGAKVLVDGAQAVSHMCIDVQALGADFFVIAVVARLAPQRRSG